ncbi:MAG: glutathione peroxidase [Chitinophagales bacterium]
MKTIYDFEVNYINDEPLNWGDFKGKKLLIVNVASACGYTPQYAQLQELYEAQQDKLNILAFPCNDFGAQEPGSPTEIQAFCTVNFGVKFPLTEKIGITTNKHVIYNFLEKESNTEVEWNFHKFLLDEEGKILESMQSGVSPFDEQILNHLK